jgi:hypothetical protein
VLDANIGAEPDPHDGGDETAHAAVVAQRQNSTGSGAERTSRTRAEARKLPAAPDQRRTDLAAELDGHVAAVRDREEHESSVAPSVDAKTAECQVTLDAPGHDHLDADPKTQLHVDATTAQRACPQ